jgi:hypothetical protein
MRLAPLLRTCLVAAVASLALPSPVRAQPDEVDRKAATRLFNEGRDLMAQKRFREACDKFEEGYSRAKGLGLQYHMADCYEALGQLARAYELFSEVADVAGRVGQHDRQKIALARAEALVPRLSRMSLRVEQPVPGLTLLVDDEPLPASQWSASLPIDSGRHEVVASARGYETWRTAVEVKGGETVQLSVPALKPLADGAPPGDPMPADAPADGVSGAMVAGLVIGGVGLVGVGVGAALGLAAKGKDSDADAFCDETGCTPEGLELVDDAQSLGNVATGVFIPGAALLVGGIVLVVVGASDDGSDAAWLPLLPSVGPGHAGATLHGRF